jgi:3-oxoacyl-[acyl-carrier-protein] synthase III
MASAATTAAAEADMAVGDADYYVVPHFGRDLLRRECLDVLGIELGRTTWNWGRQVGHLGAADQFAGLTYLSECGRLVPGTRVLVIGVGGGFNWTCIVIEVLERPAWSA